MRGLPLSALTAVCSADQTIAYLISSTRSCLLSAELQENIVAKKYIVYEWKITLQQTLQTTGSKSVHYQTCRQGKLRNKEYCQH